MPEFYEEEKQKLQESAPELVAPDYSKYARPTSTEPDTPQFKRDYEVIEIVGQGGMGTVYRVLDRSLAKELAIKVIRPELATDQAALKRFEQESRALSELNHPNIVAVFESGKTLSGAPYLVMNYIPGKSLAHEVKTLGKLDVSRCLALFLQICDALHYAHDKGVVHRDLKPSNIILTGESGNESAQVVDFGIAKVMTKPGETVTGLTQIGDVFGTPTYMSPEQCNGEQLDARSDIYSLGCVMFEALSGTPPFVESNPFKLMTKHVTERAPALSEKHINVGLSNVVAKCLEKTPERRYQNIDQLVEDLVRIRKGQPAIHATKKVFDEVATKKVMSDVKTSLSNFPHLKTILVLAIIAVFLTPPIVAYFFPETKPMLALPFDPARSDEVPLAVAIKVARKPEINKLHIAGLKPLPLEARTSFVQETPLTMLERAELRAQLIHVMQENPRTTEPIIKMGRRVIPALLEEVRNPDQRIAHPSAIILSRIGDEAIPSLIELFKIDSNKNIGDAIIMMQDRGVKAMSTLFYDPDPQVRIRALFSLRDEYSTESLPTPVTDRVMRLMLEDEETMVREAAAKLLSNEPSSSVEDALSWTALNDSSDACRIAATSSLMQVALKEGDLSQATLNVVAWVLQNDRETVKMRVLEHSAGSRNFLTPAFAPYLKAAYQSASPETRFSLVSRLTHDSNTALALLPEIVETLKMNRKRYYSIVTLIKNLGPPARAALPALREIRSDFWTQSQTSRYHNSYLSEIEMLDEAIKELSR